LAAEFPNVQIYRQELARSLSILGGLAMARRNASDAIGHCQRAVELFAKLVEEAPGVPDYRTSLAAAANTLGSALLFADRLEEAEASYRRAASAHEALAAEFRSEPRQRLFLAGVYVNVASILHSRGRPEESLKTFAKAEALLEGALKVDDRLVQAKKFLRNLRYNRAMLFLQQGRPADALLDAEGSLALDDGQERFTILAIRAQAHLAKKDHAAAAKDAEAVANAHTVGPRTLLQAAAVLNAVADAAVNEPSREQYAGRAIAVLRRVRDAGAFRDPSTVAEIREGKTFSSLSKRADFRALWKSEK